MLKNSLNTTLLLVFQLLKNALLAGCGVFMLFPILAQQPFHYTFNDENGLPSNEVYQIVQDKKGYLWLGTDAGLFRFDGNSFKAYKNNKQNGRSISNLVFDIEGKLWCRNFNGQIFKITDDTLRLVADESKSANKFQICFTDQPGYWKFDDNCLTKHDENGKLKFKFSHHLTGELIGNGTDMIFHKGKIWIEIAAKGLYVYDPKKNKLSSVFPTIDGVSYQNQRLFINQDRLCLMRSESAPSVHNYLYKINTEDHSYVNIYYFMNPLQIRNYHFSEDSKKRLWIASSFGAICIPEIHLFTLPEMICFKEQKISSVLEDHEGNFWFTDLQKGLHVIPELFSKTYDKTVNTEDRGEITLMKKLNETTMVIGHYDGSVGFYNPILKKCTYPEAINQHKGIAVKDLYYQDGLLYIARGHLLVYDLSTEKVIIPELFGNARGMLIHNQQLISIHPEYVSSVDLSSIRDKKVLKPNKLVDRGGRAILKDPQSELIYLALNDGLHVLQDSKVKALTYKGEAIHASVLVSGKNSIFAGTQQQGILEIKNGKVIRRFLYANELSDITIRTLYTRGDHLWAVTNSDFIRIHLKNGKRKIYSRNIGVNPKDVNTLSSIGDLLFLGSKKHFLSLPLNLEPTNQTKPIIYLKNIQFDQGVLSSANQTIPHDFSNLRFEFISFSYKSRKDFHYTYRLIGFDTTWNYLSHESPFVIFSSLPSGSYTFEVKAVNESGLSGNTIRYSFTVDSPIWQRGWFYAIVSIISLLIMAFIFQGRIRYLRKRSEIEKRLIQSQLSALKAQMNPHFMYNALNSIQALILKQDIKNSNLYLSKFSNLMRKVLDASGEDMISLQEETDILLLYLDLEKLRFGEDFNYRVHVDSSIATYQVNIPSMILQPFVENALKHGLLHKKGEKILEIDFKRKGENLLCTIKDNGIGRVRSREIKERINSGHRSFASDATEKRVELLNSFARGEYNVEVIDIYDHDLPSGTEVRITIPYQSDSESQNYTSET